MKKPTTTRYTPEQKKQMLADYLTGMTISAVARKHNCGLQTVIYQCRGFIRRDTRHIPLEAFADLKAQGLTVKEIAFKLKCCTQTAYVKLRELRGL